MCIIIMISAEYWEAESGFGNFPAPCDLSQQSGLLTGCDYYILHVIVGWKNDWNVRRNLSCAQRKEREAMRGCPGLIDSLMSYMQSCVAEENADDKVAFWTCNDSSFYVH